MWSDSPRFCISAGMPDNDESANATAGDANSEVFLEDGISVSFTCDLTAVVHFALFDVLRLICDLYRSRFEMR